MDEEMEKLYAVLYAREREIMNLREGYVITSRLYTESLDTIRAIAINTIHASKASEIAANKALLAANKSLIEGVRNFV